jgi:hypothetical protein
MSKHHSTQDRVSKEAEVSNARNAHKFDAGTALENLRAEMIEVEALARAAEEAADELPAATTAQQRLVFGRIQTLATKASRQASASLDFANEQVTALSAQMAGRRKAAAR